MADTDSAVSWTGWSAAAPAARGGRPQHLADTRSRLLQLEPALIVDANGGTRRRGRGRRAGRQSDGSHSHQRTRRRSETGLVGGLDVALSHGSGPGPRVGVVLEGGLLRRHRARRRVRRGVCMRSAWVTVILDSTTLFLRLPVVRSWRRLACWRHCAKLRQTLAGISSRGPAWPGIWPPWHPRVRPRRCLSPPPPRTWGRPGDGGSPARGRGEQPADLRQSRVAVACLPAPDPLRPEDLRHLCPFRNHSPSRSGSGSVLACPTPPCSRPIATPLAPRAAMATRAVQLAAAVLAILIGLGAGCGGLCPRADSGG